MESSERADTFAAYYETIQWGSQWERVQPPPAPADDKPPLALNPNDFTEEELSQVIAKLRGGKAPGCDNVLPDFWIALSSNADAATVLLHLLNKTWRAKQVPNSWKHATVVTLFKKGSTALPENYRPISLLSVSYKVLAGLLLLRLQTGGVEERLRESAFGFRARRSTGDAIFIAKRLIENTLAKKEGVLSLVLLDWAKAFDRIKPSAMLQALTRFGITAEYAQMIVAIFTDRTFQVKDGSRLSSTRKQTTGIAQGCPLSPYLFIIMLSMILEDTDASTAGGNKDVIDTTYADDTLLASKSIPQLQVYLSSLIEIAAAYGLLPNWSKTKHLQIHHARDVYTTSGDALET